MIWVYITVILVIIAVTGFILGFCSFKQKCHNEIPIIYDDSALVDKITVGIKTFFRPHCLENCITSIRARYPHIPIIVTDDGDSESKFLNRKIVEKINNCRYIELPFDSGLSCSRNLMVKESKTPYFFLTDDDFYFTNSVNLEKMLEFLESTQYSLLGGICSESRYHSKSFSRKFKTIRKNNGIYHVQTKDVKIPVDYTKLHIYESDTVHNFFLADRHALIQSPWDDKLKLGEHEKFFVEFFLAGYKCAYSENIQFKEMLDRKYLKNIQKLRDRTKPGGEFDPSRYVVFQE